MTVLRTTVQHVEVKDEAPDQVALIVRPAGQVVHLAEYGPQGPTGPQGPQGPAGPPLTSYSYNQATPSATWVIAHNLNRHPSVTVVSSAGDVVIGSVAYTNANSLTITFTAAFAGDAYLN